MLIPYEYLILKKIASEGNGTKDFCKKELGWRFHEETFDTLVKIRFLRPSHNNPDLYYVCHEAKRDIDEFRRFLALDSL